MAKKLTHPPAPIFEQIKRLDENGTKCWSARDLARVLDYAGYRNFLPVIERAKEACQNSGHAVADHFVEMHEMVTIDYAIFQNFGYQGLYGGLNAKDIHARKGLKKSQHILDHMGSTELAANLFRATQTEDKLGRENIQGKDKANKTHLEVGKKVRQTIQELGGTMPENLPGEGSIRELERKGKKNLNPSKK